MSLLRTLLEAIAGQYFKPGGHVVTGPNGEDRTITSQHLTRAAEDGEKNCDRCMDGYLLSAMDHCGECGRVG